jgi:hypothetical protein
MRRVRSNFSRLDERSMVRMSLHPCTRFMMFLPGFFCIFIIKPVKLVHIVSYPHISLFSLMRFSPFSLMRFSLSQFFFNFITVLHLRYNFKANQGSSISELVLRFFIFFIVFILFETSFLGFFMVTISELICKLGTGFSLSF